MSKKYALFIGRWQPPHNGHMHIIKEALDAGKNVAVGFRDTEIGIDDPYTLQERKHMFRRIFAEMGISEDRYKLVDIPDIESVNIGRKVGYEVVRYDAPADIEGISATAVRVAIENDDPTWETKVPAAVADFLNKKMGKVKRPKASASTLPGRVVWLTGLPCSGKTTIANELRHPRIARLDGDVVRQGLCKDLGFTDADREENLRRIAHTAALMADAGQTVVCSFVSPMKAQRDMVRDIIGAERFKLVFVDASVEECKKRDVKGMYAKAEAGEIANFTGVSAPYEAPLDADLVVHTDSEDVQTSAKKVQPLTRG